MSKKIPIDTDKLSKKYKLDAKKVIYCWKEDYTDREISERFKWDLLSIMRLRQEIEKMHVKYRLEQKRIKAQQA